MDDTRDMDRETIQADCEELTERKRWSFLGLPFTFTKYVLQSNKLVVDSGLFTTVEDDILLYRVMDVSLRRTLFQKMFGLGTIQVISSDKTSSNLEIRNIKHYREFKDALTERVDRERLRMRTRTSEMVGIIGDDDSDPDPDMY